VIRARRGAAAGDPGLVTGLLGAAALARAARGAIAELAADGDRAGHRAGETDDRAGDAGEPRRGDELIDVVLGIAALVAAVARALPDGGPAAAELVEPVEPQREPRELLR